MILLANHPNRFVHFYLKSFLVYLTQFLLRNFKLLPLYKQEKYHFDIKKLLFVQFLLQLKIIYRIAAWFYFLQGWTTTCLFSSHAALHEGLAFHHHLSWWLFEFGWQISDYLNLFLAKFLFINASPFCIKVIRFFSNLCVYYLQLGLKRLGCTGFNHQRERGFGSDKSAVGSGFEHIKVIGFYFV